MQQYKEFVEEAIGYYKSLPFETRELYKRYMINLRMPDGVSNKPSKEADAFADKVSESMGLKFDLIITDSGIKGSLKNIEIVDSERVEAATRKHMPGEDKVASFVHAYARKAIVMRVPSGESASINVLSVNHGPAPIFLSLVVEDDAHLSLSEYYFSTSHEQSVVTPVHELHVGKRAEVDLSLLHNENAKTDIGNLCKGSVGEHSGVRFSSAYIGGGYTRARTDLDVSDHAKVDVSEIVFSSDGQKFDIGSTVTNSKPYSTGIVNSGAVMSGKSICVLKGFAKIVKGARGVNSHVNQHGLILDADARIECLPDMSIDYSNDVTAGHSAGTAPISRDVLFYLTSRGIPEAEARKLYIMGFLSKYLANIRDIKMKEIIIATMLEKMNKSSFGTVPDTRIEKYWVLESAKK